jgi:hypothetical protein
MFEPAHLVEGTRCLDCDKLESCESATSPERLGNVNTRECCVKGNRGVLRTLPVRYRRESISILST